MSTTTAASTYGLRTPPTSEAGSGLTADSASEYCKRKFDEALGKCEALLGDDDYKAICEVDDCEELLAKLGALHASYTARAIPRLINQMKPLLEPLQHLVHLYAVLHSSNPVKTGIIWGSLSLLITVALKSEKVLSNFLSLLEELNHSLGLLSDYEAAAVPSAFMEKSLTELFVEVLLFCASTIHFLRNHTIENLAMIAWPKGVAQNFGEMSTRISERLRRIKETALLSASLNHGSRSTPTSELQHHSQIELAQEMETLVLQQEGAQPNPPVHYTTAKAKLPFFDKKSFFGREDEMAALHSVLDHNDLDVKHRSLVAWGTGGIGKSQIALAYAYDRKSAGVPAVIWINSETQIDLWKSFTEAAFALPLPGAIRGDGATNVFLVTSWLQTVDAPWLLIFDNAEDISIVKDCWPTANYGSVLITSRHEIIDQRLYSLEVPCFTNEQGLELILKTVGRKEYSAEESKFAEDLSSELGGLPLALLLMAAQVRKRGMQFKTFLPFYSQHRSKFHAKMNDDLRPFYKHSLKTAWSVAFVSLDDHANAAKIFSLFCLSAPDSIPMELLNHDPTATLPHALKFCKDSWELEEAMETLVTSTLIRKDAKSNMVFIHRVIQQEWRNTMSTAALRTSFKEQTELLFNSFPKLVNGGSLRNSWPMCNKYISHVRVLSEMFEEHKYAPTYPGEFKTLAELLAAAGWFLHESGTPVECKQMLKIAYAACDDKSLVYATLLNNEAAIEVRSNHNDAAIKLLEECKIIRTGLLPADHEELANVYNNMSMALMSEARFEEAEVLLFGAMAIDLKKPIKTQEMILHTRYLNFGWLYALMGRSKDSRKQLALGRKYVISRFGDNTYYIATAERYSAWLDLKEGDVSGARIRYERAYKILTSIYKLHRTISATTYMLGALELVDGNIPASINWLQSTLLMARYNAAGVNNGEVARVLRKLADALYASKEIGEAQGCHVEAETIRQELQGAAFHHLPDQESTYELLVAAQFRT